MTADAQLAERVRNSVRDIPDFPKPGILFKDITPLLADAVLFGDVVSRFASRLADARIDVIAGIESRGFIFAAPVALELGAAFVPIRKVGKLPSKTMRVDYDLEYGTDALEAHTDAIGTGQRVAIIDDLLATGGTAEAAGRLVQSLGGELAAYAFVIELAFLGGRQRLGNAALHALVQYD